MKEFSLIVTIDGPAGAGKSTVARRLAQHLGFDFLDTGAMYRCVTLKCLRAGFDLSDTQRIVEVARDSKIDLAGKSVFLDGQDVTIDIRDPNVTKAIRSIADNRSVRAMMVQAQRTWTHGKNVVTEGRDQGTVAFPNAECKIFLTASPEERARRRVAQLIDLGVDASYLEILAMQNQRDLQDTQREQGRLEPAHDAIMLWTDGLTEEQVLERLIQIVAEKRDQSISVSATPPHAQGASQSSSLGDQNNS